MQVQRKTPGRWARWRALLDRSIHTSIVRLRQFESRRKQRLFCGTYIGVTGSCGKSTTSALIAAILARFGETGSVIDLNHGTGMLRPMRRLTAPVDYFVQEISAHGPGALSTVLGGVRVDVAVITSIGSDHGSRYRRADMTVPEAIALEKGRLVEAVPPSGLCCLNADDPLVAAMAGRTRGRVVTYGKAPSATLRASQVDARWPGRLQFELAVDGRTYRVVTRMFGTLMLGNVLAALAVVHGLGLDLGLAIETISTFDPYDQRMGVVAGNDGKTYVVDTFKAPYWSTMLLVEDLPSLGTDKLTFVLGDMSDIRNDSRRRYRQILRRLSVLAETVVATGDASRYAAGLEQEGHANIVIAPAAVDVARFLDSQPAGLVYLKANSTSQLWRVLEQVTPRRQMASRGLP